jgi:hypothetical protein
MRRIAIAALVVAFLGAADAVERAVERHAAGVERALSL